MENEQDKNNQPSAIPAQPVEKPAKRTYTRFEECQDQEAFINLLFDNTNQPLGHMAHSLASALPEASIPKFFDKLLSHPTLEKPALRIVNHIFNGSAQTDIEDLRRANVLLGYPTMRNILLICALINRLVEDKSTPLALEGIAISYLAAVYTTNILKHTDKVHNLEPYFSTAFFHEFGEILFAYYASDRAVKLDKIRQQSSDSQLEENIVGFSLTNFTLTLSDRWQFGQSLAMLLPMIRGKAPTENTIAIGVRLAHALTKGTNSSEFIDCKRLVARALNVSSTAATDFVIQGLTQTMESLSTFSHPDLIQYIPFPQEDAPEEIKEKKAARKLASELHTKAIKDEMERVLKWVGQHPPPKEEAVFASLAKVLNELCDLDRVVLLMLDRYKKRLITHDIKQTKPATFMDRFSLQVEDDEYFDEFQVHLRKPEGYLMQHLMFERKSAWVGHVDNPVLKRLRHSRLNKIVGNGQFFVAPIIIAHERVGLVYADRNISYRQLDLKAYQCFVDLCIRYNKALTILKARG